MAFGQGRTLVFAGMVGFLGAVGPAWLALEFAVPADDPAPSAARNGPHWTEISLGPARFDDLPVAPRTIRAITLYPEHVRDLRRRYENHRYDLTAIAEGRRDVPPIFVRNLPPDWRSLEQVDARKRMFVKTTLPLILKVNAEIRGQRQRLQELTAKAAGDLSRLSLQSRSWLEWLAQRYRLREVDLDALKQRVDAIPVSLALAQAAIESGWGTSRFARQGNALFGQWTWDTSQGIKPKDPQKDKGSYAVRSFTSLGQSIAAYMHNLNTHPAYSALRKRRAALRSQDKPLDAEALAAGLLRYSQRGEAYVAEVRATIRANDFARFDRSVLASGPIS